MASDWGGEFVRTNSTKTKCIKEMGARIFQGAVKLTF
jgi:hypothetical protein